MKRFFKVIACLLAFLLFAYLLLIDYPRFTDSLSMGGSADGEDSTLRSSSEADAKTTDSEAGEIASLQLQAEALEQELDELREQSGPVPVALFFTQCDDVVYNELYPAMAEAGYTGTIVFQDGALTGNYQIIETSEFNTMHAAGWEYAIGGDSTDLNLDGEDTVQAWQTSLETYMRRLRTRTGITPTLYVFREEEYQTKYDAVLEELGYTALLYSGKEEAEDTAASALTKLIGFSISAETDSETLLEELKNCACAVLVAEVDETSSPVEDAFPTEDYLSLLEELQADGDITITTGTALLETASDGQRQALLEQIQTKEAELAQVQAQLE